MLSMSILPLQTFLDHACRPATPFGGTNLWQDFMVQRHRAAIAHLTGGPADQPETSPSRIAGRWLILADVHVCGEEASRCAPGQDIWTDGRDVFVRQGFLEEDLLRSTQSGETLVTWSESLPYRIAALARDFQAGGPTHPAPVAVQEEPPVPGMFSASDLADMEKAWLSATPFAHPALETLYDNVMALANPLPSENGSLALLGLLEETTGTTASHPTRTSRLVSLTLVNGFVESRLKGIPHDELAHRPVLCRAFLALALGAVPFMNDRESGCEVLADTLAFAFIDELQSRHGAAPKDCWPAPPVLQLEALCSMWGHFYHDDSPRTELALVQILEKRTTCDQHDRYDIFHAILGTDGPCQFDGQDLGDLDLGEVCPAIGVNPNPSAEGKDSLFGELFGSFSFRQFSDAESPLTPLPMVRAIDKLLGFGAVMTREDVCALMNALCEMDFPPRSRVEDFARLVRESAGRLPLSLKGEIPALLVDALMGTEASGRAPDYPTLEDRFQVFLDEKVIDMQGPLTDSQLALLDRLQGSLFARDWAVALQQDRLGELEAGKPGITRHRM